jgi:hypothetical protein
LPSIVPIGPPDRLGTVQTVYRAGKNQEHGIQLGFGVVPPIYARPGGGVSSG